MTDARLLAIMSAALYKPHPVVPQRFIDAAKREMNGEDAMRLVREVQASSFDNPPRVVSDFSNGGIPHDRPTQIRRR